MIVVADSSPINYLVLINEVDVLHKLFGEVAIPDGVASELSAENAPNVVKRWLAEAPPWLQIETVSEAAMRAVDAPQLHRGEREAIALARALDADYLVMDEMAGRRAAEARQLTVVGTLGVLEKADVEDLLDDFPKVLDRLDQTSFYMRRDLKQRLLERYHTRQQSDR